MHLVSKFVTIAPLSLNFEDLISLRWSSYAHMVPFDLTKYGPQLIFHVVQTGRGVPVAAQLRSHKAFAGASRTSLLLALTARKTFTRA